MANRLRDLPGVLLFMIAAVAILLAVNVATYLSDAREAPYSNVLPEVTSVPQLTENNPCVTGHFVTSMIEGQSEPYAAILCVNEEGFLLRNPYDENDYLMFLEDELEAGSY